jgi:hypothetical protein
MLFSEVENHQEKPGWLKQVMPVYPEVKLSFNNYILPQMQRCHATRGAWHLSEIMGKGTDARFIKCDLLIYS